MKKWTEYWVEYECIDTPYGLRANYIKCFKTEAEASEFLKTVPDGKLVGVKCETC